MRKLDVDPTLVGCLVDGTYKGLRMTGVEPDVVGISKFSNAKGELTVIVGLHGKRSGYVTMNLSKGTAIYLASRIIGEELTTLDDDTIDAICEIGNMVAGQIHNHLSGTQFQSTGISLPALIFGANYNFYHAKNLTSLSVQFEIREVSIVNMDDKFFTTSLAILGKS